MAQKYMASRSDAVGHVDHPVPDSDAGRIGVRMA
jgi:hypothetical protein